MKQTNRRVRWGLVLLILMLGIGNLSGSRTIAQDQYTVYFPIVANQAGEPQILHVPIPEGVTLHFTNPQVYRDRTGKVFASTRANSSIGGVVWTVVDGSAVVLFPLDPKQFYANGELAIWPDGKLYYTTAPCATPPDCSGTREMVVYEVPGWTP